MQVINSDPIEIFLSKSYRHSQSYSTVRSYRGGLKKFTKFLADKKKISVEELLSICHKKELESLDILDDFYSYLSENNLSVNPIVNYVSIVKEFLNSNGMHIYNEDLKHKFRLPKRTQTYEEGLTRKRIARVLHNSPSKLQTVIMMVASSGMRIGELAQLRLSDVDFSTTPTTIKIRRETCKTNETRFTCVSSEATVALKDYLSKNFGWSEGYSGDWYLFMKVSDNADSKQYFNTVLSTKTVLQRMLSKVVRNIPDLDIKNENGQNNIHFHAFRKWFKTQVTTAGQSDFAEALMGHTSIKLTYFRQDTEQRLKTYLKVEPELTISDFSKIEKNMDDLKEKINFLSEDLEKSNEENTLLKNKIASIQRTQALSDLETKKTILRILRQQKIVP